jgi:TetR/AcrR family transcriptional regulator, transcriptional repressor for nem operon
MPRKRTYIANDLLDAALRQFWTFGYSATSIDDLVRVTGVSRHGIYADFVDKRGLFLSCLAYYRSKVVDPAFCCVEQPDAVIADIGMYFETQITAAEKEGLPGPGCFFGNSATERAPHDNEVMDIVSEHNQRIMRGFAQAISNSASARVRKDSALKKQLAASTLVFSNGLWAMSRTTDSAKALRSSAKAFLNLLEARVNHDDH